MNALKLIYDAREALKQYTDDQEIDDRYILYLYGIKRTKYLRQDLNNFQHTTDISVTQTLCLELEVVTANQCGLDIECETILRTKRPIPQPIELHTKPAITSVKSTNRISIPFTFTTKEKAIYSKYSPFNKGIFAFLDNDNHIYLVSQLNALKMIECVTITAVFEDPLDLMDYSNCCGCEDSVPCFDLTNIDYPIQAHYIDLIKNEIVRDLIQELKIPEDKENNSNND